MFAHALFQEERAVVAGARVEQVPVRPHPLGVRVRDAEHEHVRAAEERHVAELLDDVALCAGVRKEGGWVR